MMVIYVLVKRCWADNRRCLSTAVADEIAGPRGDTIRDSSIFTLLDME